MKPTRFGVAWLVISGLILSSFPTPCLATAVQDEVRAPEETLGEHEELVFEPVFQGRVAVHHCGKESLPAVVLIHGMGENGMRDWRTVLPELEGRYRILAFDLPGFARSDKQNVLYTMTLYAAFVKWAVDTYIEGPFTLVGHSFGGAVALRFAATFPRDLERLVLVDVAGVQHEVAMAKFMLDQQAGRMLPGYKISPLPGILQELADTVFQELSRYPVDVDMAVGSPLTRERLMGADPMKIAGFSLAFEDFGQLFRLVETPTLIIWGAEDAVTPLRTASVLQQRLANSRLEVIPSSGHVPMVDQSSAFNRRLLEELAAPPRAPPVRSAELKSRQPGDRVGRCENQRGVTFVGGYDRIEISNCRGVKVQDVVTRGMIVEGSEVEMEGCDIRGGGIGLVVRTSTLRVTASKISGDIAVSASGSRLDLAAVDLVASTASIHVEQRSSLVASVCTVKSPQGDGPLHDHRDLNAGDRL